MTRQDQKEFINSLMDVIKQDIINKIDNDKIPDNWEGLELRHYLVKKSEISDYMWNRQSRAKKSNFNNDIAVNNLFS